MSFTNLSTGMQSLVLYQTDFLLKLILLFIMVGVSIFYLFYFRKTIKPTEIKSISYANSLMTIYSFFILMFTPLFIMFLHPNYLFLDIYTIYLWLYLINIMLFIWIGGMDLFRFLPALIINMAGIKVDSKYYDEVKGWFKRNFK